MAKAKLKSMTGFGRAAHQEKGIQLEVEIRTVNSRNLDTNLRAPREYAAFETTIRSDLARHFLRGRVDVSVTRVVVGAGETGVTLNRALFDGYLAAIEEVATDHGLWGEELKRKVASELLVKRELLVEKPVDVTEEEGLLRKALEDAALNALKMRIQEGAALEADLKARLAEIGRLVSCIQAEDTGRLEEKRENLQQRITTLSQDTGVDEQRLAQELSLLIDRLDISEELTRLQSHIDQFTSSLTEDRVGRRLEFLLQEFGRELNTIGSKAQHALIQQLVVSAKGELERMREQAQNIE